MKNDKVQIVIKINQGSLILSSGLTLPTNYETVTNLPFWA